MSTGTPAAAWYYRRHGKQCGPLSLDVLQSLAQTGGLQANDEVRTSRDSTWTSVGAVAALRSLVQEHAHSHAKSADLLEQLLDDTDSADNQRPTTQNDRWTVRMAGQSDTGMSLPGLESMIRDGLVRPDSLVRRGRGEWLPAGRYSQLQPVFREVALAPAAADTSVEFDQITTVDLQQRQSRKPVEVRPVRRSEQPRRPEWFCQTLGQVLGPFHLETLREMAADGQLHPVDLVRKGHGTTWRKAGTISGLVNAFPRKPKQRRPGQLSDSEIQELLTEPSRASARSRPASPVETSPTESTRTPPTAASSRSDSEHRPVAAATVITSPRGWEQPVSVRTPGAASYAPAATRRVAPKMQGLGFDPVLDVPGGWKSIAGALGAFLLAALYFAGVLPNSVPGFGENPTVLAAVTIRNDVDSLSEGSPPGEIWTRYVALQAPKREELIERLSDSSSPKDAILLQVLREDIPKLAIDEDRDKTVRKILTSIQTILADG